MKGNDRRKEREEAQRFFMVSISAPERRAALTALSSFLAAEVGAFLRRTTGSQSCERGPTPDIFG